MDLLSDNSGNSYVVGYTGRFAFSPINTSLLKYSSAGVLQWEGIFDSPGNQNDDVKKIILDGSYAVYTAGTITNQGTSADIFLNKYNNLGTLLWQVTYDGGNTYDRAEGFVNG